MKDMEKVDRAARFKKGPPPPILTDATSEVKEAELSYSNLLRLLFLDSLQEMKGANAGMQHDRDYFSQ
jgi:hypothetical protein